MEQSKLNKGNLKSLCHDPDHYIKAFHVFAQASDKYKVLTNWCDNVFSDQVVEKLKVNIRDGEEFRALGIGVGSGEIDTVMMSQLAKRYPRISNCAVDPADEQIKLYKDLINTKSDKLQGITFDWRKQGIDEFRMARAEGGDTTKFHFISAIHSMYHVSDLKDSVKWLYDQLEDGGMILIITMSDDSGAWRLSYRYKIFEDQLQHCCNSAMIRDIFTKFNIPSAIYKQKSRMNITDAFEENNTNGQLKVDFLAAVVDFHGNASPELRQEFMEFLGSPECSEREDGEILYKEDWDAVIATK